LGRKEDIDQVLQENKIRYKNWLRATQEYNPYIGIGSPVDRFSLRYGQATIYLPVEMKRESFVRELIEKGVEGVMKEQEVSKQTVDELFISIRVRYDYEYWCATCVKIEDADTNEMVPLLLTLPQRLSLQDREAQRLRGKWVRQIELKHRQYGSSTEKNAYIFWRQNVCTKGMNVYLCSLDKSGATEIVRRYENIIKYYPRELGRFGLKRYKMSGSTFIVEGSNSTLNIGSAENPNAPSGRTVQAVLISEAGKMASTEAKGANKLITNMVSMVRLSPETYILVESTAEQVGVWFRKQVYKAEAGTSAFQLTFIKWTSDERCSLQLHEDEWEAFVRTWGEYEWKLWREHDCTIQQIYWYKEKESAYDQAWEMRQENPTTIDEAFAGAGKKVYSPDMIKIAQKTVRDPDYIGDIVGDANIGSRALDNIQFESDSAGLLQIWRHPKAYPTPKPVANRYCIYVDIGGTTKDADWSVIKVVDRAPMLEGGYTEVAGVWRGHVDPELLAWKAGQIGKFFRVHEEYSKLAIEVNSLYSRGNTTDGIHYLTVINQLAGKYPNLYIRDNEENIKTQVSKYGFHMTARSKDMLVSSLKTAWRPLEGGYVERSQNAVDEAKFFEIKEDGKMGAIQGEHDDELIASGGVAWLSMYEMQAPRYMDRNALKTKQATVYNEAVV
jgi:hypothetical protein